MDAAAASEADLRRGAGESASAGVAWGVVGVGEVGGGGEDGAGGIGGVEVGWGEECVVMVGVDGDGVCIF